MLMMKDIGVFHPDKKDAMNHEITTSVYHESNGDVTYVSVESFISRLNSLIALYGHMPLRFLIQGSFRGESRRWYDNELLESERNTLCMDPSSNLDLWKAALRKRFALLSPVALQRLASPHDVPTPSLQMWHNPPTKGDFPRQL